MRIAITGSRGLIGSAVGAALAAEGHIVVPVICSARPSADGSVALDASRPDAQQHQALDALDAFIHLAGENIAAGRWTRERKARILKSRVAVTEAVFRTLAALPAPPRAVLVASATGIYGDRGGALLSEADADLERRLSLETAKGADFLALVCDAWEAATRTTPPLAARVVNLRFGAVLSGRGGALAQMLQVFKLGLGGVLGSGKQYFSWIAIDDAVSAIRHALTCDSLAGPVNVVAPNPVTNAEFTKVLGKVLHRPTVFPVPAIAARLAFGELTDGLLFASQRAIPRKLLDSGYIFNYPVLENALRHILDT